MSDMIPTDAEDMAIAAMLINGSIMSKSARMLQPEHFGGDIHRMTYAACLNLWRDGKAVDLVTVANALKRTNQLDTVGGAFWLAGLTTRLASTAHFTDHAAIIREYHSLRVLRHTGMKLMNNANPGEDPEELISSMNVDIEKASGADVENDVNAADMAYTLLNSTDKPKPIYLGMASLDDMVFILDSNVVTLRAPAGVGKTAFVLSAVLNLMTQRKPWFVSLEMPASELVTRTLCQLALVDIDLAMIDRMTDDERVRMAHVANEYGSILKGLDIDDTGSMTVDTFCAKAEYKVKNEGCTLIVIDYAQLLDYSTTEHRNPAEGLKHVSKSIRSTARKLNVPILCIVHVNREGSEEGSSQFEKDAHVRLSLSREHGSDTMQIDVVKNRNGRTGQVSVPVVMRHGIVGRFGPPAWSAQPPKPITPRINMPRPDNRIEPRTDAPF